MRAPLGITFLCIGLLPYSLMVHSRVEHGEDAGFDGRWLHASPSPVPSPLGAQ